MCILVYLNFLSPDVYEITAFYYPYIVYLNPIKGTTRSLALDDAYLLVTIALVLNLSSYENKIIL